MLKSKGNNNNYFIKGIFENQMLSHLNIYQNLNQKLIFTRKPSQ